MHIEDFEIAPSEFDRRRAWAHRNGKYMWYWPEIAPADWRRELERLENAVRDVLTNGGATLHRADNIPALSLAAYTSGIGPLVGYWIEQGMVDADADAAALFALHLDQNRRRMNALAAQTRRIIEAFLSEGLDVTVLKGMDLAFSCYPEPGTRPVSDIDLVVDPGVGQARAAELLAQSGFVMTGQNFKETTWVPSNVGGVRSLLLTHAEDPWAIDLHDTIDQQPSSGAARTTLGRHIHNFREPGCVHHHAAATLAQPALVLYLAAHIGASFRINTSLVRLVDLVLVIRRDTAANRLDWDAFLDLGNRTGSLELTFASLTLAEKLIPGTVPVRVLDVSAKEVPNAARALLRGLTPSGAQQLDRTSVKEHYMWARGVTGMMRQLWADLAPPDMPLRDSLARYRRLARRAWTRGFSR